MNDVFSLDKIIKKISCSASCADHMFHMNNIWFMYRILHIDIYVPFAAMYSKYSMLLLLRQMPKYLCYNVV